MNQGTTEAAAPVIGHPGSDLDLQQFCGDEETRPYLLKPFRFGDYSYATNGHILVRVAARDGDTAPEKAPAKLEGHVTEIFARMGEAVFSVPAPVTLPPVPSVRGECEACAGRGYEHDCPDCCCECKICGGHGDLDQEKRTSTSFGGAFFALNYVRQILALPALEIAVGTSDWDEGLPMLFRFEGGMGALMALRNQSKNHVEIELAQLPAHG